jgi:hypothetical protein
MMTSFDDSAILNSTPNSKTPQEPSSPQSIPAPVATSNDGDASGNEETNATDKNDTDSFSNSVKEHKDKDEQKEKMKAEKKAAKKLLKELTICKIILEEMEVR